MPRSEAIVTHLGGCGVVERELQVEVVILHVRIFEGIGHSGRCEGRSAGDVSRVLEGHRRGRDAGCEADWVGVRGICRKLNQWIRDRLFGLDRKAASQNEVTGAHRVDDKADARLYMPVLRIEGPIASAAYVDQLRRCGIEGNESIFSLGGCATPLHPNSAFEGDARRPLIAVLHESIRSEEHTSE